MDRNDYLTPSEAAARLRVTGETIRRWIREGRLPARRVGPRLWRLRPEDVDGMAAVAGLAPPEEATRRAE